MPILYATGSSLATLIGAAVAQSMPAIPSPPAHIPAYVVASANDDAKQALPKGRSQAQSTKQATRTSGYAGNRPAAYTRPAGQHVYTSNAYPPAHAQTASAAATRGAQQQRAAVARGTADGMRAEARLGWDQIRSEGATSRSSEDARLHGFGIGYDRNFGNIFVGGYASIDWTGASFDRKSTSARTTGSVENMVTFDFGQDTEYGVRLGYWFDEYMNVYGFAARSDLEVDYTVSAVVVTPADPKVTNSTEKRSTPVVSKREKNFSGWRIGAGSEYLLQNGLYAKAEYRYSNYGSDNIIPDDDLDRHQFTTGLGIRF